MILSIAYFSNTVDNFFRYFLKIQFLKNKMSSIRFELTICLLQDQRLDPWATKLLYKKR